MIDPLYTADNTLIVVESTHSCLNKKKQNLHHSAQPPTPINIMISVISPANNLLKVHLHDRYHPTKF